MPAVTLPKITVIKADFILAEPVSTPFNTPIRASVTTVTAILMPNTVSIGKQ